MSSFDRSVTYRGRVSPALIMGAILLFSSAYDATLSPAQATPEHVAERTASFMYDVSLLIDTVRAVEQGRWSHERTQRLIELTRLLRDLNDPKMDEYFTRQVSSFLMSRWVQSGEGRKVLLVDSHLPLDARLVIRYDSGLEEIVVLRSGKITEILAQREGFVPHTLRLLLPGDADADSLR